MRVLIFNYEFPPAGGGAGRATWHLCRHLADLGVDVDAIVSSGLGPSASTETEHARIHAVTTHRRSEHETGPLAMVEYLFRARPLARRLIAARQPDLVHYFFSVPTGLLSFGIGADRPYIVSLRGGDIPGFNPGEFECGHRILAPLNRTILRRANAIVALSDDLKRAAERFEPSVGYDVIRNGVDTEHFRPIDPAVHERTPRKLLYVGRYVEWKKLRHLIEAVRLLPPDYTLDLVGTGAQEAELRRLTSALGLNDRIRFHGPKSHEDLPRYYQAADIFVMPSIAESFSQVTAEAMASGLPVIAARAGALPELIVHGVNGLLVEAEQSRSIAEAINTLANDAPLWRAMAVRNRIDSRERHSWREVSRRYVALYERALSSVNPTAATTSRTGMASTR